MELFLPIFRSLGTAKIRYITVGGLATVLHGFTRVTGDIDLILDFDSENLRKALEVFSELGFRPRAPVPILDFADESKREEWIGDKGLEVFSLHSATFKPLEIDLFVREPMPFSELWGRSVEIPVSDAFIRIVGVDDLIALKERAGRAKDLEDIRVLKRLTAQKNEG